MSDWVTIYSSNNANQVEIIRSLLEHNDIKTVVINKMDSMHTHLMNAEIKLHVNAKDAVNAKYIISKNQL